MMSLPPLFSESFPSFIKEQINDHMSVLWYHPEFSQSRYPPGQKKSEACTLICLLLAQSIGKKKIKVWRVENCLELNILMAEAIIEGNNIHAWLLEKEIISHPYLNTVEALEYGGKNLNKVKEWKFRVFHENIEIGLSTNIKTFLEDWYKHPRSENLFMLLITCGRTILFIFQEQINKVFLFDSHAHNTLRNIRFGLVVAQTTIYNLKELCDWYIQAVLHGCYNTISDQYELAFLYEQQNENQLFKSCNCNNITHK